MAKTLDGLVTFYSWHHAMRAEKVLGRGEFWVELIPAPRELSPNCGTALRFEYSRRLEVSRVLMTSRVKIETIHSYVPELESKTVVPREESPVMEQLRGWLAIAFRVRNKEEM